LALILSGVELVDGVADLEVGAEASVDGAAASVDGAADLAMTLSGIHSGVADLAVGAVGAVASADLAVGADGTLTTLDTGILTDPFFMVAV